MTIASVFVSSAFAGGGMDGGGGNPAGLEAAWISYEIFQETKSLPEFKDPIYQFRASNAPMDNFLVYGNRSVPVACEQNFVTKGDRKIDPYEEGINGCVIDPKLWDKLSYPEKVQNLFDAYVSSELICENFQIPCDQTKMRRDFKRLPLPPRLDDQCNSPETTDYYAEVDGLFQEIESDMKKICSISFDFVLCDIGYGKGAIGMIHKLRSDLHARVHFTAGESLRAFMDEQVSTALNESGYDEIFINIPDWKLIADYRMKKALLSHEVFSLLMRENTGQYFTSARYYGWLINRSCKLRNKKCP